MKIWNSVKARILMTVGIMVLPAAVLMYNAYHSIRFDINSITHVIDEPLEELITTREIQNAIVRTELPFYLYMNRGETADREAFIRLAVEIDLKFDTFQKKIDSVYQVSHNELALFRAATAEWQAAKKLGESLLTTSNIPENNILMARIDQFSRHLERANSMLLEFSELALNKVNNRRFTTQNNEWQSIGKLTFVFSMGLLLAMLTAISLSHTVINPLRRIQEAVDRLGEGDTNTRIHLSSKNELGKLASSFNLIAEKCAQVKKELEHISVHDNLTGLFDQPKFIKEVSVEIERAKRYCRSFSVLLIDIKNFRHVNKEYGHLVGDSVLCSVANKISSTIRPTDIASRYGGDEFAVILSETDVNGARESAQRLVEAIESQPLNIGDGKTLDITVQISQVTYPQDAEDENTLFTLAENSLSSSNT